MLVAKIYFFTNAFEWMNFKEETGQSFEYLIRSIFIFNKIDKKFLSEKTV